MNIALVTSSFFPTIGGAEIAVHQEALNLLKLGHRVVVFAPYRVTHYKHRLPYSVIPFWPKTFAVAIKYPRGGQLNMRLQLVPYVRSGFFDVWHVQVGYPAGYSILPLIRQMSLPAVLTCQGKDIQKDLQSNYGFRLNSDTEDRIEETVRSFPIVTSVSETVEKEYLALGVKPDRIRSVPNGVDVDRLSCQMNRAEIRKRHGIGMDEKLVLTVGRNHPKKGVRFLVEAAAQLRRRTTLSFRILFVGRGVSELQRLVQSPGVESCVSTLEQIDSLETDDEIGSLPSKALIELYQAADVFVLPSLIETFGMVLAEAMACGLPIVTTDAPGCRDVIEHV